MGVYNEARTKTKKKFQNVFLQLYKEKCINRITVKEITDLAGFTRGTFYLHFKDVYDILDSIEDELLTNSKYISFTNKTNSNANDVISDAIDLFESYGDSLCILLSENGDPKFIIEYKNRLKQNIIKMLALNDKHKQIDDFQLEFVVSGMLSSIIYWYTERPFEIEELFGRIYHLVVVSIGI